MNNKVKIRLFPLIWFAFFSCSERGIISLSEVAVMLDSARYREVLEYFEMAEKGEELSAEAWNLRAAAYYGLGIFDSALLCCDWSLSLDSANYRPWYNRANANYRLGRPGTALPDYIRAIDLRPDRADLYINRGNTYMLLSAPSEAYEDYTFALRLEPDSFLANYNLARSLYALDSLEASAEVLLKCIAKDPVYAPAIYQLAVVREAQRHRDEACLLVSRALELGYSDAMNLAGRVCPEVIPGYEFSDGQ